MNLEKFLGMLGLARRAGKVIIGTAEVCLSMPRGRTALVIVSDEASAATKKRLTTKCDFYGIKKITVSIGMSELARRLGKTTTPACVAVTDDGFAAQLIKLAESTEATNTAEI